MSKNELEALKVKVGEALKEQIGQHKKDDENLEWETWETQTTGFSGILREHIHPTNW